MRPICIALELGATRPRYLLVDLRPSEGRSSSVRIVVETPGQPLLDREAFGREATVHADRVAAQPLTPDDAR